MVIKILDHQSDFINSGKRHTGLVGGFRSGKSYAGVLKTIAKKMLMPKVDVAYYLPTYPLIKDIAFPKFTEILTHQNIPFELNKTDKDIHTPFGRIILRSMDNPDLIVGYEVGYSLVDEADVLSKDKMQEVMIKILARNSVSHPNTNNATDFVSTPEGFKFLYDFFISKPSENKVLIKAKTENNPFISEDYIQSLQEQYSKEQLDAYLNGEFVNMNNGSVYRDFKREIHIKPFAEKIYKPFIGMDFNITNMAGIVFVQYENTLHAIHEYDGFYDTNELCLAIKQDYPNANVYPDASGKNRRSNGNTDHEIIRSHGFIVYSQSSNPFVKDRVNEINKRFRDGTLFIDPKCKSLITALEQQTYAKSGEPDKSSGLDHILDSFGYGVWGRKTMVTKTSASHVQRW